MRRKIIAKKTLNTFLIASVIGLMFVLIPEAGASARPLPEDIPLHSFSASGYCPSYGGSHEYEYIKSVSCEPKSGGTMAITVIIYIANPTGCTYGEECPEYDGSPEYINGWIDWNGDEVFEEEERVLDVALTGYLGINYHGDMSTSNIVTIPKDAVSSTYMRVNLGWGFDPNDPCTESWDWGDVDDQEVKLPPKIKEIIVTGIPDAKNPMTNDPSTAVVEKVKLEAKITPAEGYTVLEVWWWGDIKEGEGKTYEYIANPGTHGRTFVGCTMIYKNIATGELGADIKTRWFKLFFVRDGNDDAPADTIPNWYEYWTPLVTAIEGPLKPMWYRGGGDFGEYLYPGGPNTPAAGQPHHDSIAIDRLARLANPATGHTGIDTFGETITHENEHVTHYQNWVLAGLPDADGDWKPDSLETNEDHNLNGILDTEDLDSDGILDVDVDNPPLGNFPGPEDIDTDGDGTLEYEDTGITRWSDGTWNPADPQGGTLVVIGAGNGVIDTEDDNGNGVLDAGGTLSNVVDTDGNGIDDEDELCYQAESNWVVPNQNLYNQDWANPGKQSNGVNNPPKLLPQKKKSILPLSPKAAFNGTYSDYGTDDNGNGLHDYLIVEAGVDVITEGNYKIEAGLKATNEIIFWTETNKYLNAGSQSVTLSFDGVSLHQYRVDGPYHLVYLKLHDENLVLQDAIYDAHVTSPYNYTEFEGPIAEFTDTYSDYGTDTDNDGLYNYLTVEVGVNATTAGDYIMQGGLYDSNGKPIDVGTTSTHLDAGIQSVTLNFDGLAINRNRVDGPYYLRYLSLSGSGQVDFVHDAYTTSVYSYTDFQKTEAGFTGSYSDYGQDTDTDGLYNYLTIEAGIDVSAPGNYTLTGWLYDQTGTEIVMTSNSASLGAGSQIIPLDFDGLSIYKQRVDGPYNLKYLALYDGNGTLMDALNYAYTTSFYSYTDFQKPLIFLTGNYSDYGTETDGDGIFDYLTVEVEVILANPGYAIINARLMDINGNEIVWAENTTYLEANLPQIIQLNFDGPSIYNHGVAGSYYLRDVYIYHTGDPTQSDYIYEAYTTSPYNYTDFQPIARILTIASTSGGNVTMPGEGTFTYNASEVVDLVAAADSGYQFVNWTGDVGTIGNVSAASTNITMDGDYTIVANFDTMEVMRDLPPDALDFDAEYPGDTFDVYVNFTSPEDDFNSIGLTDFAPAGWEVETDVNWCSPVADWTMSPGNKAEYAWNGPFGEGTNFTAKYRVTIPATASPGINEWPNCTPLPCCEGSPITHYEVWLEYWFGAEGPFDSCITGEYQKIVTVPGCVVGETRDVVGNVLDTVQVALFETVHVWEVSDSSSIVGTIAVYENCADDTGYYYQIASKYCYFPINTSDMPGTRNPNYPLLIDWSTPELLAAGNVTNFVGDYGLVCKAASLSYAMEAVNHMLFVPLGDDGVTPEPDWQLSNWKAMQVVNSWQFPAGCACC